MPLLGDGSWRRAPGENQHKHLANGPEAWEASADREGGVEELQFLTLAALLVSFPEGTGKWGHGKKCDIFPKATWRSSDSPGTAWREGGVLLPKEGMCPC